MTPILSDTEFTVKPNDFENCLRFGKTNKKEIFCVNIYFRIMRWSYIVNVLRKLNKDEFSRLLVSEIIRKYIKTIK